MCQKIDIDEFTNDSDSDTTSRDTTSRDTTSRDTTSISDTTSNSTSSSYDEDDYVATFTNFPVIYLFIESLEGTLEDIIQKEMNLDLLKSCLFQITFALIYLQKHYYFTHNDLHINNIMYQSTDRPYLNKIRTPETKVLGVFF